MQNINFTKIALCCTDSNCQYTKTNQRADGAVGIAGVDTETKCLDACTSDAACLAVEFSTTLGCWKHTKATYTTTLRDDAAISFFTKGTCGE